jgi:hypothetical protein
MTCGERPHVQAPEDPPPAANDLARLADALRTIGHVGRPCYRPGVCSELPFRHSFHASTSSKDDFGGQKLAAAKLPLTPLPAAVGLSQFGTVSDCTDQRALDGPFTVELFAAACFERSPGLSRPGRTRRQVRTPCAGTRRTNLAGLAPELPLYPSGGFVPSFALTRFAHRCLTQRA